MQITQLEFETILAGLPAATGDEPGGARLAKPRPGLNAVNFTLALAQALRAESLTHALFNILTAAARSQASRGYATIPQVALDIGVSFNAVHQQLIKSPHFFRKTRECSRAFGTLIRIELTPEAITLLHSINQRARKYAVATK